MHVLFVAYFFPPDPEIGGLRPHRFAKYLERLGFSTEVIAAGPNFQPLTQGNVHRLRGDGLGHAPTRMEILSRKILGVNGWGFTWSRRATGFAARLISDPRNTALFSTSPPLCSHRAALALKRAFPKLRWIADFRDPLTYGDDAAIGVCGPLFGRLLERRIFAAADVVIANTDTAADRWREQFPQHRDKIQVLTNGFDPEDPLSASPLPDRPHRVLAYFGSLYAGRQPRQLFSSALRLAAAGRLDTSRLRIHLVGSPAAAAGDALPLSEELGCVEYTERVPRPEARRLMTTSDYLLLLDLNSETGGLHIPAKVFEYVRIGRPILTYTCQGSAVERLLDRSGVPHTCVYFTDPDDVADNKLDAFLSLPTEPVEPAEAFQEDFSAPSQVARLAEWLTGSPAVRPVAVTTSR